MGPRFLSHLEPVLNKQLGFQFKFEIKKLIFRAFALIEVVVEAN